MEIYRVTWVDVDTGAEHSADHDGYSGAYASALDIASGVSDVRVNGESLSDLTPNDGAHTMPYTWQWCDASGYDITASIWADDDAIEKRLWTPNADLVEVWTRVTVSDPWERGTV